MFFDYYRLIISIYIIVAGKIIINLSKNNNIKGAYINLIITLIGIYIMITIFYVMPLVR